MPKHHSKARAFFSHFHHRALFSHFHHNEHSKKLTTPNSSEVTPNPIEINSFNPTVIIDDETVQNYVKHFVDIKSKIDPYMEMIDKEFSDICLFDTKNSTLYFNEQLVDKVMKLQNQLINIASSQDLIEQLQRLIKRGVTFKKKEAQTMLSDAIPLLRKIEAEIYNVSGNYIQYLNELKKNESDENKNEIEGRILKIQEISQTLPKKFSFEKGEVANLVSPPTCR